MRKQGADHQAALLRAELLRPVFLELVGLSAHKAAAELNRRGVPTPDSGHWHAQTVQRVRRRLQTKPPSMSAAEYVAALARLGWRPGSAEALVFLDIAERTSYRYAATGGIPRVTALLLRWLAMSGQRPEEIAALPIIGNESGGGGCRVCEVNQ